MFVFTRINRTRAFGPQSSGMGKECNMLWILTDSGCPGFHPFPQTEAKKHNRNLVCIIAMVMVYN